MIINNILYFYNILVSRCSGIFTTVSILYIIQYIYINLIYFILHIIYYVLYIYILD